ncbi:MAG: hypothetical protein ABSB87_01470 [Terriglobales bacterium]|jgi:hypothetical protein
MDVDATTGQATGGQNTIELPSPTAWPIVLALGVTLLFAGMVTSASISILGAVLSVVGAVGWFRDVLPNEKHEFLAVASEQTSASTKRHQVARVHWADFDLNRARLPLAIYPVSAGIKGGLVGSVVMAAFALTYGIVSKHGIWYPINLLSAGLFTGRDTTEQLTQFHMDGFLLAAVLHLLVSFMVGLLYGATLPMIPRRPILLGGLVAPILWSGLLHSTLEIIDPVLNHRIDWAWFVVSQIGFGVAAGVVVSRQVKIQTWQGFPLAIRAGMETSGRDKDDNAGEDRK